MVSYGILRNIDLNDIYHTSSTREGSSGVPIILIESFKVIGIHKGALSNKKMKFNQGISMKNVLSVFLSNYNSKEYKKKEIIKNEKERKNPKNTTKESK